MKLFVEQTAQDRDIHNNHPKAYMAYCFKTEWAWQLTIHPIPLLSDDYCE